MRPKINLLYVENDELAAELLKWQLGNDDFNVKIVSDGRQAWKLFQLCIPDILLLGIELPYLDGFEIIRLIRGVNQKTPIVLYSSHLSPMQNLEAINLGVDDCIPKDCNSELFIAKLKRIYDRVTKDEADLQVYILSEISKFNVVAGILTIRDKLIPLKPSDSRLLYLLCAKFGELSDNNYLIEGLWGKANSNKEGSLRRCVNQLRTVLADDPNIIIKNQYSIGYTLTTFKFDSISNSFDKII